MLSAFTKFDPFLGYPRGSGCSPLQIEVDQSLATITAQNPQGWSGYFDVRASVFLTIFFFQLFEQGQQIRQQALRDRCNSEKCEEDGYLSNCEDGKQCSGHVDSVQAYGHQEYDSSYVSSLQAVDDSVAVEEPMLVENNFCTSCEVENRWSESLEQFDSQAGCNNFRFDGKESSRRGLVPRRLGEGRSGDKRAFQFDNRTVMKARLQPDCQSSSMGRQSSPLPWLQDTTRKLRRTEQWCPRPLVSAIDESEAQDMCFSIERGIISDSVTLPPELLSP